MYENIIAALETNGIGFDWDSFKSELLNSKQAEQRSKMEQLAALLNCSIDDVLDPKKLIWKLYDKGIYPESLSLEYIKANRDQSEIFSLLYKYKKLKQFLNQYGDKLHQKMRNGRIYGKWSIDGAKTGRMTCKEPNLQAFPGAVKPYFIPAEGMCFVSGDYSQIELRVLAELSQDENMIDMLVRGTDIHKHTASVILGKPVEDITVDDRAIGKKVNFGMCYGISAYGLCETINKYVANQITLEDANLMKMRFYNTYPKIGDYHNRLLTADVIESLAGNRWVDYPKGIGRINLPVQASAAEGLKLALAMLMPVLPAECLLVNVIHDEIILEVPAEQSLQMATLLEKCMVEGLRSIIKTVPVTVTININNIGGI